MLSANFNILDNQAVIQKAKKRSYLDSGYSRCMMDDKEQFVTLETKERIVTFEDNGKGCIIGFGKIRITPSTFIKNMLHVKGLKHNLISISQLYNKGYKVLFELLLCIITNPIDDSIVFIGHRQDNVYMIDLNKLSTNDHYFIAIQAKINETNQLGHRKLGHTSIHLITKLIKKNLVKEILSISFEENKICDVCQLGK